jgi:sulfatase modifying factor 1
MTQLTVVRRIAAMLLPAAWLGAGCMLDFNEAIPCTIDDECPTSQVCDTLVGRCTSGDVDRDTGPDPEDTDEPDDTDERDGRPIPDIGDGDINPEDAGDGSGDPDAGDADDADDGETDGDVVDPDGGDSDADGGGADACVPTPEVCDGLDNDCNDLEDDGIDCAGCGTDMVRVENADASAFCIDLYEASRSDATATVEGVDETRATSRAGVLPWRFVTYDVASAACTAAGKRICEAVEWQRACSGPEAWVYPYNARVYTGTTCNGINTPPLSGPALTGNFTGCVSPAGVFDMSGNVSEWTTNRFPIGGAYDDVSANLRCTSENRAVNPSVGEPQAGFRCCRSL